MYERCLAFAEPSIYCRYLQVLSLVKKIIGQNRNQYCLEKFPPFYLGQDAF